MGPEAFPQAPFDPVAGHGLAHFFADGKPDLQLPSRGKQHYQIAAGGRMSLPVDILERPVLLQPVPSFHLTVTFSLPRSSLYDEKPALFNGAGLILILTAFNRPTELNRQFLAATAAAGCQHPASIPGGHAGAETMDLAALTLLGLISTKHCQHSSSEILRELPSRLLQKQLLKYKGRTFACQDLFFNPFCVDGNCIIIYI